MPNWEYKRIIITPASAEATFNELGAVGWELVAVEGESVRTVPIATFKRETGVPVEPVPTEVEQAIEMLVSDDVPKKDEP